MLKIENSKNLKPEILNKIIDFDKNYYNFLLNDVELKIKYKKLFDHYLLLFDGNKLVGYILYFFISREKYQEILESKNIIDVIPENQEKVKNSKKIFLRAVVSKDYQELNWQMMLYNEFSLNLKNIEVETIIAYAEQEESRRFY